MDKVHDPGQVCELYEELWSIFVSAAKKPWACKSSWVKGAQGFEKSLRKSSRLCQHPSASSFQ